MWDVTLVMVVLMMTVQEVVSHECYKNLPFFLL